MAEDPKQTQTSRLSSLEAALGGKYKILERIGAGGFGEVYLGEHVQLRRKVAIKLLSSSLTGQEDLVKRFEREARAAATLSHPNIIDIYDVGEAGDLHYFVMKYIDGETLAEKMHREKRISPNEAVHIIRQVAEALGYAHQHDIVHRDIKPANVMLDQFGKPVLMDFGVARVQYEGNLTKTGTLMGTPHYLPPELPLGKKVDGRSDIYSLGIMLYEMLSSRPPFHDENSVALIFKHINEPPQPLKELVPDLDVELCNIVHKMIEKLPEKRYQNAEEVADALQALTYIYPPPTPQAIRRSSTPGVTQNTEKLLLLAQEHLQQQKLSKAIELYATITKRDPNNETAKREIAELLNTVAEKLSRHVSQKEFAQARQLLSQAEQLSPQNERLAQIRTEIEQAEEIYRHEQEVEFQVHYEAAQMALQSNNAASAIEHLTAACTIHSDNQEVKELLRQTRERITGEINVLCEKLDFDSAGNMLNLSRDTFPELIQAKSGSIERHQLLYQKLLQARDLRQQEKWEEAAGAFEDFLGENPSYDFEVFGSLRKEAEDSLAKVREKIAVLTPAAVVPVPSEMKPEPKTAEPAKAVPRPGAPGRNWNRILVPAGIVVVIALIAVGATTFLHKSANTPAPSPTDVSLLHKLVEPRLKAEQEAKMIKGEISVTSNPQGAKVLLGEEEKGVTPLKMSGLALGKYALKLQLKGYKDLETEVELTEQKSAIEVPLTLESTAPVVGTLQIESTPAGAAVLINNRNVGVTPKKLSNVNVGKYTVTLRLDGFHEYNASVRVKEAETATLSAKLEPVPKATTPEQPKPTEVKPGELVTMGPDVVAPKAIKKTSAKYPDAAKEKKLEGTVKLNVLISETGQIADVTVIQSAHPILDEAAIKAVRDWVYEPARKQGVPVKVWIPISISFIKR